MFKTTSILLSVTILLLAGVSCRKDNVDIDKLNYNIYEYSDSSYPALIIDSTDKERYNPYTDYHIYVTMDTRPFKPRPRKFSICYGLGRKADNVFIYRYLPPQDTIRHFRVTFSDKKADTLDMTLTLNFDDDTLFNQVSGLIPFPTKK
jgi:hypothetical protein